MSAETLIQRSFARAIYALDDRLRRRRQVFDYCDSPDCMLRAEIIPAGGRIVLADGLRIEPDDRIVDLHYRTETFPPYRFDVASIGWARLILERIDFSLEALCRSLKADGAFDDVSAIRAAPLLRNARQTRQFERIASHFGFAPANLVDPLPGRPSGVGANIVSLLLIAARNPAALHADLLIGLRPPMFISRKRLEDRYRRDIPRDAV